MSKRKSLKGNRETKFNSDGPLNSSHHGKGNSDKHRAKGVKRKPKYKESIHDIDY